MPTLHGLDEEFGEHTVAQVGDRKTRTLIAVALGACIIGGLALASSTVHEGLRLKLGSAAISSQNTGGDGLRQLVDGLLLQVEALKDEIQELSKAPPAHAIAGLEANPEPGNSITPVYWYSDPAALSFGIESQPDPWGAAVPLPPRPAKARPALR